MFILLFWEREHEDDREDRLQRGQFVARIEEPSVKRNSKKMALGRIQIPGITQMLQLVFKLKLSECSDLTKRYKQVTAKFATSKSTY